MRGQSSKFMVGLFMTVGTLIAAGAIVWIGASKYFEKGKRYVTYFDESVQGLQRDSTVKYRGVEVGRVEKIRVAPDNKLIEIVMKIDMEEDLEKSTVANLKAAGITGIVFVELDRREPRGPDLSPTIDFGAEYPIIPSRPSDIRQIFSGIDDVIKKLRQIDVKGIFDQMKSTARTAENFLSGTQMKHILANLDSSTANLDRTMARMEKITAEGHIEKSLVEARQTLAEAKALIIGMKGELKAMRFGETAGRAHQVVDTMARATRASAVEAQAAAENLRRASESLERIMERLEASPSDLIFSKPEAGRTR